MKVKGAQYENYCGLARRGLYNNIWLTAARALDSELTQFGGPGWSTGPLDFLQT